MSETTLFDKNIELADSISNEPSTVGKKLIEIADNFRSLSKVDNDDDIGFCSEIINRCGISINMARYSMLTEVMGVKLRDISKDDVSEIVSGLKELIVNLKVVNSERNNHITFAALKKVYFSAGKVPTF